MAVERHTSLEEAAPEWDELADRAGAHPFVRPGWIGAWLRAFGSGRLELLTLRRDGRLAAVLPLLRRRGALVSPTNWHTPLGGVLAEDDEARRELVAAALASRPRSLSLAFLAGGGEVRAAAEQARYAVVDETLLRSPTLALTGDWESYLAGRNAKQTKQLARRRRKLAERGELALEVDEGVERLEEGLVVEGSGWKAERGTAILSRPETAAFYREVAAWAAARGTLRLFFLRVGGRPAAFQYTLLDGGSLYSLKVGYDVELRAYAPGQQIASDILEWSFRNGVQRFEFLGGEEPQKLHWTDEVRELRRVQAFAPTVAGRLERAAWVHGRPLARRLLQRVRRR